MKRFLIPLLASFALPSAVNAFPFGDIVVKSNIGEKYIQSAELNLADNIARIDIKNMPESQYMILKNVSCNFNVIIASDNTQALNGLVNGEILLNLKK